MASLFSLLPDPPLPQQMPSPTPPEPEPEALYQTDRAALTGGLHTGLHGGDQCDSWHRPRQTPRRRVTSSSSGERAAARRRVLPPESPSEHEEWAHRTPEPRGVTNLT